MKKIVFFLYKLQKNERMEFYFGLNLKDLQFVKKCKLITV